jgi:hypothetical protein
VHKVLVARQVPAWERLSAGKSQPFAIESLPVHNCSTWLCIVDDVSATLLPWHCFGILDNDEVHHWSGARYTDGQRGRSRAAQPGRGMACYYAARTAFHVVLNETNAAAGRVWAFPSLRNATQGRFLRHRHGLLPFVSAWSVLTCVGRVQRWLALALFIIEKNGTG